MKRIFMILVCIILGVSFTACSKMNKTPDEAKILSDYTAKATEFTYVNFTKAEFVRQQYNKENKEFKADVKFTGKDDYAVYETTVNLIYNYYDDQGWMLDGYSDSEVVCQCFRGMTKEEINKYDLDDFVETSTAIYDSNEFDEVNNMHYFYFNTRSGRYRVREYREKVIFEYKNGKWGYVDTEQLLTNTYLDIEGTTWTATPKKNGEDYYNIGPNIYIQSVSGVEKISFKYGEEKIEATLPQKGIYYTEKGIGYVYMVTNTKTIYKIFIKNINSNEPTIVVYPTSNANSSLKWIEYDLKK